MERAIVPTGLVLMIASGGSEDDVVVQLGLRWADHHEMDALVVITPTDPHACLCEVDLARWRRRHLGHHRHRARIEVIVGRGPTPGGVPALAEQRRATLIVAGPGRPGVLRTEALLRRSRVPVLVARPGGGAAHVVVGTDLKDPHYPIVRAGANAGRRTGASVTVLHAVEPVAPPVKRARARFALGTEWQAARVEAAERLIQRSLWYAGVEADSVVVESPATKALDEVAQGLGAELIIVGTRRRRVGGRAAVGTTAQALVRDAPCSVLVVPLPPPP